MRIRTRQITIDVDVISEVVDIGELVKMATKLGFSVVVEPADSEEDEAGDYVVRMLRGTRNWAEVDVASIAMLCGYAQGRSGDQVLESIRQRMVKMHFPLDRPIQDVMEIGGGPVHDGHDHD